MAPIAGHGCPIPLCCDACLLARFPILVGVRGSCSTSAISRGTKADISYCSLFYKERYPGREALVGEESPKNMDLQDIYRVSEQFLVEVAQLRWLPTSGTDRNYKKKKSEHRPSQCRAVVVAAEQRTAGRPIVHRYSEVSGVTCRLSLAPPLVSTNIVADHRKKIADQRHRPALSPVQKSECDPNKNRTRLALLEGERPSHYYTAAHLPRGRAQPSLTPPDFYKMTALQPELPNLRSQRYLPCLRAVAEKLILFSVLRSAKGFSRTFWFILSSRRLPPKSTTPSGRSQGQVLPDRRPPPIQPAPASCAWGEDRVEIWAALDNEVLRANEVRMKQHQNARAGGNTIPRENPLTSGIVLHDSHMRKSLHLRSRTRLKETNTQSDHDLKNIQDCMGFLRLEGDVFPHTGFIDSSPEVPLRKPFNVANKTKACSFYRLAISVPGSTLPLPYFYGSVFGTIRRHTVKNYLTIVRSALFHHCSLHVNCTLQQTTTASLPPSKAASTILRRAVINHDQAAVCRRCVQCVEFWRCDSTRGKRSAIGYSLKDRRRNQEIRQLNIFSLNDRISQNRVNWRRHVLRMDNDTFPKLALEYHPTGRRAIGRPMNRCRMRGTDIRHVTVGETVLPQVNSWGLFIVNGGKYTLRGELQYLAFGREVTIALNGIH
ncbi:hypothetical protein PR048_032145 [Dryococelus australis]|uniref:Uncharacterized protein n=1 Tax=Dryococelus australis TaxID=614101 RepID=A0ABQ9G1D7_9NEOP|nr:hypothetical protein PR048_032145 [Dryococelus australis]